MKKSVLGRGLNALLENSKTDITTKHNGNTAPVAGSISSIRISRSKPFSATYSF